VFPTTTPLSTKRAKTLLLLGMLACARKPEAPDASASRAEPRSPSADALKLLVLPVERAEVMYERFLPLKHHLEMALRTPIAIRVASDFDAAVQAIGRGEVHLACLDPAAYCEVRAKFKDEVAPLVSAIAREGPASHSVLVAKSGGMERAVDAGGRRLALGARQSAFSYVMPLAMLDDLGIRAKDFAAVELLQQEDRVALSVLIGDFDLGGISEAVAKKYAADGLRILKRSEAASRTLICGTPALAAPLKATLIRSLEQLEDPAILSTIDPDIGGFVATEDRDYDGMRVMIRNATGQDTLEYRPETIRVAVLPLFSPMTLFERYDPVMRFLSKRTGLEFKLVIPRSFDEFMELVRGGTIEFSYQNPYVYTLLSRQTPLRALVTTMSEKDRAPVDSLRGVIIARRDSGIRDLDGLRGKRVLIVSRKSAAGFLSQRLFLRKLGIDAGKDLSLVETQRHEAVILGVYRGEAPAGFVRESALEEVEDEIDLAQIEVLARTQPMPNWPFAASAKASPALAREVERLLLELTGSELLRAAKIKGFRPANPQEFEPLKED
jgi:phosphonate transport system substrate-binding protein